MPDYTSRIVRRGLLGLSLALWVLALGCPVARTQDSAASPDDLSISELQQDISLLNEYNRLQLTKEQVQRLIPEIEALQAQRKQQQSEREAILVRLKPLLEAQKEALLKDEGVPKVVTDQIAQQQEALDKFDQDAGKALQQSTPRFQQILTQPQVDILTWVSEARVQARSLIDWAHAMSDEDFKTDAAVNAENLAEGRQNITKDQILEIFRQARALSPADYEKGRDKLVEQLIPATRDDATPLELILIRRLQPPRLPIVLKQKLALMK